MFMLVERQLDGSEVDLPSLSVLHRATEFVN